jgi:CRP-like cAMP-binding protein
MNLAAERAALVQAPLFKNLAPDVVDAAMAAARRKKQAAGTTLFRQGQPPHDLFILAEGRLKITRVAPDGSQLTVGILGPGAPAGAVALFRNIPFPATATALDDVVVFAWPRRVVDRLLREQPDFASNVLQMVGERAEFLLGRLEELGAERADQRVALALLRMVPQGGDGPAVVMTTRQDLAELSGTTIHTVSRLVAQWQRQRIVDGGRGRITVRNAKALGAIVHLSGSRAKVRD